MNGWRNSLRDHYLRVPFAPRLSQERALHLAKLAGTVSQGPAGASPLIVSASRPMDSDRQIKSYLSGSITAMLLYTQPLPKSLRHELQRPLSFISVSPA